MAICVECEYFKDSNPGAIPTCTNSDLGPTDFVYGLKNCLILNQKGECQGFKPQPKTKSIYGSKEDEQMAKVHRKVNDHLRTH